MDILKIDDILTIVNRSMEYRVSKALLCKIPYFESMLSHDFKESRENKVELDFDERAIKSIFDWLKTGSRAIKMDYVITLCNILDYFGLCDSFIAECVTYFHDNFTIAHLPVVITQVTSTSKLILSGSLNDFICRYFTKIANTNVWLDYPIETIEYICKLDLMVHSEMQVFEAIMRWFNVKCDSRKCHLERLLKLVRWCHLKDEDLSKLMENELVKSLEFNPKFCTDNIGNCDCNYNRAEQEYFVMIEKYGKSKRSYDIRIIVLANNLQPLFNRVLKLDESLPGHIIHDEHISDIHFVQPHEENKMIRIDWKNNKYRWLGFLTYFYKLLKCISIDSTNAENAMVKGSLRSLFTECRGTFIETVDKFILISKDKDSCYYCSNPSAQKFKDSDPVFKYNYSINKETVLNNKIYILTYRELIELDIDRNCEFKMFELPRSKTKKVREFHNGLRFSKLLLTSKQANDDRVIMFDRSEKNFYCFNVNTQQWSLIGKLIDCDFSVDYLMRKQIGFTSAFLSDDIIDFS